MNTQHEGAESPKNSVNKEYNCALEWVQIKEKNLVINHKQKLKSLINETNAETKPICNKKMENNFFVFSFYFTNLK